MSPESPAALLARLVGTDPGRPRITVYDDTDGPTRGERIELSARVLANWVAKAANLLQEDLDAGPGTRVLLDLPAHWRSLYWAFATWSVGAEVVLPGAEDDDAVDLVVTDDPERCALAGTSVLVTLAALARGAAVPVPQGAVDEAKDLATHGDVFVPWDEPDDDAVALTAPSGALTYAGLVPTPAGGRREHVATGETATLLEVALRVWAGDGSLVLTRGRPDTDVLAARLAAEGVEEA